jgi:hypothetical protein
MDEPDYTDPEVIVAKVLADQEMQQREATKRFKLSQRPPSPAAEAFATLQALQKREADEYRERSNYANAQLWRTCKTCGPPPEDLVDLIDEMNERDRIYYGRDKDTGEAKPGDPADALDDKFKKVLP